MPVSVSDTAIATSSVLVGVLIPVIKYSGADVQQCSKPNNSKVFVFINYRFQRNVVLRVEFKIKQAAQFLTTDHHIWRRKLQMIF